MKSEEWNISYVESSGFQLYLLVQSIATLLYWIKLQVVIPYFRLYHPLPVSIDRKKEKAGRRPTNKENKDGFFIQSYVYLLYQMKILLIWNACLWSFEVSASNETVLPLSPCPCRWPINLARIHFTSKRNTLTWNNVGILLFSSIVLIISPMLSNNFSFLIRQT